MNRAPSSPMRQSVVSVYVDTFTRPTFLGGADLALRTRTSISDPGASSPRAKLPKSITGKVLLDTALRASAISVLGIFRAIIYLIVFRDSTGIISEYQYR